MPYTTQRAHVCSSIVLPASEYFDTYLTSGGERAINVKEHQLHRRAVRERLGDHLQCSVWIMVSDVSTEQSRGWSQSPRWWTGGIYVVGRGGRRALAVISIINDAGSGEIVTLSCVILFEASHSSSNPTNESKFSISWSRSARFCEDIDVGRYPYAISCQLQISQLLQPG